MRGRVLVDGLDPCEQPARCADGSACCPMPAACTNVSRQAENVAYFGRLHGIDDTVIESRLERLVAALGMHDFIDRRTEDSRRDSAPRLQSHARWCTTAQRAAR